jgi:hypothetical protein
MQTRSKTKINILEVNVDFEEASRYWNSNKKKMQNGFYKYVCGFEKKNGNYCKKPLCKDTNRCNQHAGCDNQHAGCDNQNNQHS